MQVIENDLAFLPQMDLNSQFLRLDECQALFFHERDTYFVPAIVLGSVAFVLLTAAVIFYLCRSKVRQCLFYSCFIYKIFYLDLYYHQASVKIN